MALKKMTAEDAAAMINNDDVIGFSGFTAAGCPKVITMALAKRAEEEHAKGNPFKVGLITGASTGDSIDGVLSRAHAIKFRTPYQSNADMRKELNSRGAHYFDLHLSELAQYLRYGFIPRPKIAILEACDVTEDGKIYLTSGVGIAPTVARLADKVFVELNSYHPKGIKGMCDIYEPADPPLRREIPIYKPSDRIGVPYIQVDPAKIVGVVDTDLPNEVGGFSPSDELTNKIGKNVADFLSSEIKAGRIPAGFLPVQSGVGNIANAVLGAMGKNEEIPAFQVYTEVIQDAVVDLMKEGRVTFASGCSLTVSTPALERIYADLDFFKDKIVLRPQEISNSPELARRMGLISINTALEVDLFGNVNSTHVAGSRMMNGIGGSGDFCRNAYLSIFTAPSTAKDGKISAIVPMISHVDHSEHSVKILITEHGVADLRGLSPIQKAERIIENCVDPQYKESLRAYLAKTPNGHTPQNMEAALSFHIALGKTGDMRDAEI